MVCVGAWPRCRSRRMVTALLREHRALLSKIRRPPFPLSTAVGRKGPRAAESNLRAFVGLAQGVVSHREECQVGWLRTGVLPLFRCAVVRAREGRDCVFVKSVTILRARRGCSHKLSFRAYALLLPPPSERGQDNRDEIRRFLSKIAEAIKKIPLEEPDHWIKLLRGVYSVVYHNSGVLDHVSRFASVPPGFWLFLLAVDQDLAEETRKKGVPLWRTPALRQLPSQAHAALPPSYPSKNASD